LSILFAFEVKTTDNKACFKTCGFRFTMQGGLAGRSPAKKSFLFVVWKRCGAFRPQKGDSLGAAGYPRRTSPTVKLIAAKRNLV